MKSFHRGIGAPEANQAQAMLRAWECWANYVDNDFPKLLTPTANDVAAYLARISRPMAAPGAYSAPYRFATQLRLDFHLDNKLVAGWQTPVAGHKAKQQASRLPQTARVQECIHGRALFCDKGKNREGQVRPRSGGLSLDTPCSGTRSRSK